MSKNLLVLLLSLIILYSCTGNSDDVLKTPVYEGPVSEVYNAVNYYSDSAVVKLKIESPVRWNYEEGDIEFPKGVFIEFYDTKGDKTNTLKANHCYYTKADNEYKATGNVEMEGLQSNEKLVTEELFWNIKDEKIYTDKAVMIVTENQIIKGKGLEADQEFTSWTMKETTGIIDMSE